MLLQKNTVYNFVQLCSKRTIISMKSIAFQTRYYVNSIYKKKPFPFLIVYRKIQWMKTYLRGTVKIEYSSSPDHPSEMLNGILSLSSISLDIRVQLLEFSQILKYCISIKWTYCPKPKFNQKTTESSCNMQYVWSRKESYLYIHIYIHIHTHVYIHIHIYTHNASCITTIKQFYQKHFPFSWFK